MKKAILNIIIIILTAIICGYLIFTGMEVRNNAENTSKIENTLSNWQVRHEEIAL
ncbi:MAG: hypothetical protein IJW21_04870 [Clostridia bacterium]|nr:hypothetical protein [Clostridia bacterium]